jgi:hypothetical protein
MEYKNPKFNIFNTIMQKMSVSCHNMEVPTKQCCYDLWLRHVPFDSKTCH